MVKVTIDGREIEVPDGTLVIRAAEMLGIYVPRFCDHPLLDPLGACRQCLVEVEGQRKPLTACTTRVMPDMVVSTASEMARDGQKGVLELLLVNHPLDCPMCDKGGECPLQDQALAYGPGDSRFVDEKRRFAKPVRISPLVLLDRERCVLCARCTRFSNEIAGDPFIELFERGALEQVAIYEDEPYVSPFSGNVIQICPVGALTSSQYRFRARPFDMVSTPSVCNLCASGCNTYVQHRRGEIQRIMARENHDVNEEWSCDKGRFAYSYVHHPSRVTDPLIRKGDDFVPVSWAEAISFVSTRLLAVHRAGQRVGVLAGERLADEDAYALSRFARTALGTGDVDARLRSSSAEEDAVLASIVAAPSATYADIENAAVILVADADLREESPIVFLRLRKAARKHGVRLFEVGARRTALAAVGARSLVCAPGTEGGVLLAAAGAISARGVPLDASLSSAAGGPNGAALLEQSGVAREHVDAMAEALAMAGERAVIVAGERVARSPAALAAAWNLACALGAKFAWIPRRAGARGALWAGLHPALLPGGRALSDPAARAEVADVWGAEITVTAGRSAREILEGAAGSGALYLVGSDPAADFPDATLGARAIDEAPFVVAHDLFLTESARRADVVLPAAAFPERAGTLTSWEGRRQELSAALEPAGLARPDWEILAMIARGMGAARFPASLNEIRREIAMLDRASGAVRPVEVPAAPMRRLDEHFPFALVTYPLLLDHGTLQAGAADLAATAEPAFVEIHPEDAAAPGIAGGQVVRVSSQCGEVEAPARLSDRIARRSVFMPANQAGVRASALIDAGEPVTLVRVEKG